MRNPDWWKSIALCGLVIPMMMAERKQARQSPDSDKRCGRA